MQKNIIFLLVCIMSVSFCWGEWSVPRNMSIDLSYYGPADRPESGMVSVEFFKVYGGKFSLYGNFGGYYGEKETDKATDDIAEYTGSPTDKQTTIPLTQSTFFLPFTFGGRMDVYESKGVKYFVGLGFGLAFAVDWFHSNLLSTGAEYYTSKEDGTSLNDYLKKQTNAYYGFTYQLNAGAAYVAKPGLDVYGKLYYDGANLNRDTGVTKDLIGMGDRVKMSGWGAGLGIRFGY